MDRALGLAAVLRSIHRWTSHAAVITGVGAGIFAAAASIEERRHRRSLIPGGLVLGTLVLGASFTGSLLPWDQLGLWAVTAGTNMSGYLPFFDDQVRFVFIDGMQVSPSTFLRWLWTHVAALPIVIAIGVVVLWRSLRRPARIAAEEGDEPVLR